MAALGGHLHVLKWLHQCNCPWDELACTNAAKSGHLDVLNWLYKKKCLIWNENAYIQAELNGHEDDVEWLEDHRNPTDEGNLVRALLVM